eukprot:1043428-Prorocentrum_minimum.AAC.1
MGRDSVNGSGGAKAKPTAPPVEAHSVLVTNVHFAATPQALRAAVRTAAAVTVRLCDYDCECDCATVNVRLRRCCRRTSGAAGEWCARVSSATPTPERPSAPPSSSLPTRSP